MVYRLSAHQDFLPMNFFEEASVRFSYRTSAEGEIIEERLGSFQKDTVSQNGLFRIEWKAEEGLFRPTLRNLGTELFLENLEVSLTGSEIQIHKSVPSYSHFRLFQNGYQSWTESGMRKATDADVHCRLKWKHDMDENPENEFFSRLGRRFVLAPFPRPGRFLSDFFFGLEGRTEQGSYSFIMMAAGPGDQGVRYRVFLDSATAHLDHIAVIWDFNGSLFRRHGIIAMTPVRYFVSFHPGSTKTRLVSPEKIPNLDFASLLDRTMEETGPSFGRSHKGSIRGWCSWYHYYNKISEEIILENLRNVRQKDLSLDVFQIDDGYQKEIGDWLTTNRHFPSGMKTIADAIRSEKMRAGIWLAPFVARPGSDLAAQDSGMILRDHDGRPVSALYNPVWGGETWCLDTTHPRTQEYIRDVVAAFVSMGYDYLKLDFLYAAAYRGNHYDPSTTGAERVRKALQLIRKAAGKKTFLLACGSPLFPAAGIVDGMRISMDVNSIWKGNYQAALLRDRNFPTARGALLNSIVRSAFHGRFWLNDPDCLMVRDKNTSLTLNQTRMLASVMSLTGGMILVSDDLALLEGDRMKLLKQAFDLHKLCARHTPIPVDLMEHHFPGALYNPAGFLGVWNPTDRPQRLLLSLPPGVSEKSLLRAKNYWDGSSFAWEMQGKHLSLAMAPFESAVAVL